MAALKIAQLRPTIDAFAILYGNAGAAEQAQVLRELSKTLARADKLSVDDLVRTLEKNTRTLPSQSTKEH